MKIVFLGVGEAFDKDQPNNSSLVITKSTKLMLDCGFTAAVQLWKYSEDPNLLDGLYISHQHGDHFAAIPALLLRMWEGGRERPFTIICQKGLKDWFDDFMEKVYGGFKAKFKYEIVLVEAVEGHNIQFNELTLSFESTVHSGENLAIKITDGKNYFAYSGDGAPKAGSDFYRDLDLLVLETYLYDKEIIGHFSIVSAIKFAETNRVKCLALTHLNRDLRKNQLSEIKERVKSDTVEVMIPEPLQERTIE